MPDIDTTPSRHTAPDPKPAVSAVDSTVAAPATAVSTQAVTPESTPDVNTTAGIDTTAAAVSMATGPSATPGTDVPVQNPAEWALLAAARREIGSDTDESPTPAALTDTAQALDPTAPGAITGVVVSALAAPADAQPISATASASGPDPVIATVGLDIAVSGPLAGIAVSPDGSRVYIASALRGAIQIIDARNGASLGVIQVGPNLPWIGTPALNGIAINGDGTRLYVSSVNALSVVSTAGGVIATFPTSLGSRVLAASPDGTRVYVGNSSSTVVSIIDTTSGAILATIPTATDTQGVTVSPDGARAYLLNTATHGYSVLDTVTNTVIDTVSLGDDITPAGLAVREDGKRIYVTTVGANARLYVLDANSGAVINSMPATGVVVVSPDGTRAFAITSSLLTSSTVTVIDTRTGKAINASEVNLALTNLTISPDGKRIYALDGVFWKVGILDTDVLANNPRDTTDPLADLRANLTAVYTQAVQAVNDFVAATTDALRAFVGAVADVVGAAQLTVQGLAHDLTERFIDFVTGGVAEAEPTFTSYLYTHLRAKTEHAVNGIATEEVVGPDGIPRMIVYLGGSTGDINNQSWWKNLPSYGGAVDDKQIDAIIAALDGRHREILLVGYSQGGLDAQNIAASGRLGDQVKAVVTFGSPITTPPSEHYKTVHLADINDFVPKVSLFDPAKWKTLTLNVIGGTPFIGLSTTGFQDYAGVHGSQKTYAQIGIQFDRWSGRQDAKQIINRFQGPIMNVPDF